MRRFPVFLVLDVSDSMVGEPRWLLEKGLETLIQLLRQNPHAMETTCTAKEERYARQIG
uniref:VWA domain-containing protein n=1 Tax=Candidatus Kentrum sp. SD TaxID=2126332 RepID=A0A450Z012_9GAMM|nr:MAG: hypothetical protein BECKSD772F_GA0070984_109813 [Candidatus Kentron sp. SD]VFK47082.1 MAG: hypothetical protein BECKSD772E_GA0070983_108714 [Candidatus Kentron sp. SD]